MTNTVTQSVLQWLDDVIIGQNLCPFAAKPKRLQQIHLDIFEGCEHKLLMEQLITALTELDHFSAEERETTLIIIPNFLQKFEDYNQFLDDADWLLERGGWQGIYQIASFHPNYQFAGTQPQDPENLTNRSPYPILHLIREDSMSAVLDKYPNPEEIPENNIKKMESLDETEKMRLFPFLQINKH